MRSKVEAELANLEVPRRQKRAHGYVDLYHSHPLEGR